MKKNLFLTFCFSFIPGAGQMYQGYMKRGLSIMIIFALSIALSVMVGTPIFTIPIPIVIAYSFFDTYNIRNRMGGDQVVEDEYIWKSLELEEIFGNKNKIKRNSVVGVILILVGAYLIFNTVFHTLAVRFGLTYLRVFSDIFMQFLPPVIIAVLSISLGLKFLTKDKK